MKKCIDCGKEFNPNVDGASDIRGPICNQKHANRKPAESLFDDVFKNLKESDFTVPERPLPPKPNYDNNYKKLEALVETTTIKGHVHNIGRSRIEWLHGLSEFERREYIKNTNRPEDLAVLSTKTMKIDDQILIIQNKHCPEYVRQSTTEWCVSYSRTLFSNLYNFNLHKHKYPLMWAHLLSTSLITKSERLLIQRTLQEMGIKVEVA